VCVCVCVCVYLLFLNIYAIIFLILGGGWCAINMDPSVCSVVVITLKLFC